MHWVGMRDTDIICALGVLRRPRSTTALEDTALFSNFRQVHMHACFQKLTDEATEHIHEI